MQPMHLVDLDLVLMWC